MRTVGETLDFINEALARMPAARKTESRYRFLARAYARGVVDGTEQSLLQMRAYIVGEPTGDLKR